MKSSGEAQTAFNRNKRYKALGDSKMGGEVAVHARADAVDVVNRSGGSAIVIACDHASNHIPASFGTLGLSAVELMRHIAWDPGALPVSEMLARDLDATLVASRFSRLIVDCNRPLDAPDLISPVSETTPIPGNARLSTADREARLSLAYHPFHDAINDVVEERLAAGRPTILVSVHSFTPVYKGVSRRWHAGIIHDEDRRIADPLIAALEAEPGIVVGRNEPYSPADRVYFTLEKHARSRGLPCAMIEIRNDEIADVDGQRRWADMLGKALARIAQAESDVATRGIKARA